MNKNELINYFNNDPFIGVSIKLDILSRFSEYKYHDECHLFLKRFQEQNEKKKNSIDVDYTEREEL